MSERQEQHSPLDEQPQGPGQDQGGVEVDEHVAGEDQVGTGMTPEEAEGFVELARSGETDVPVGADDFVEALRVVAAQRDEQRALLQRTAADYQNFQRRARQSEKETRELTSAGVVQSLLQVLDFFDMALKQNPETATAQQVMGGVEMIKAEFLRVLSGHGVGLLTPAGGDEFDPTRHEAVEQRTGTETSPGLVIETSSPGYTMGDRIVRPAKVVVAAAEHEAEGSADTEPPSNTDGES